MLVGTWYCPSDAVMVMESLALRLLSCPSPHHPQETKRASLRVFSWDLCSKVFFLFFAPICKLRSSRNTKPSFFVSSRLIESLILFPSSSILFPGIVDVSWKWVSRKLQQHPRKALLSSEEVSRLSEWMARAHNRKSRLLKTAAEMTKLSRRIIFVDYKRFPMTQREMSPRNGAQQQLLLALPP